jgi:hypothetical protein
MPLPSSSHPGRVFSNPLPTPLDTSFPSVVVTDDERAYVAGFFKQPHRSASVRIPEHAPAADPAPSFMVHYDKETRTSVPGCVRYRLKCTPEARRFKDKHGVAEGWEDFERKTPCDPWHCHNKNHVPDRPRKKYMQIDGKPHANTKHGLCCTRVPESHRKNCDECTARRRKPPSKDASTSKEPAVEVIAQLPLIPQPVAVIAMKGGYRAHKEVVQPVQESVTVLYHLCTILPWRLMCESKHFPRRQHGDNPYYDEARHAKFDVPWAGPSPEKLCSVAKNLKTQLRANVRKRNSSRPLPQWVHTYANSPASQQRYIVLAPAEMLKQLRDAEPDYVNACDLTELLPKSALAALLQIILVVGLALHGGKNPKHPCDIAELLGAHPRAIRQTWHSDTLGRIRRMNALLRITADGHGSYQSTLVFTHRNYTYNNGAVDDLVGAMEDDWDTGAGLGDDAIHRMELDTADVFELMSDMIHAGPGNPGDTWRFMLFLSWPMSLAKGDLESDVGTYSAWKKFFAEHSSQ